MRRAGHAPYAYICLGTGSSFSLTRWMWPASPGTGFHTACCAASLAFSGRTRTATSTFSATPSGAEGAAMAVGARQRVPAG